MRQQGVRMEKWPMLLQVIKVQPDASARETSRLTSSLMMKIVRIRRKPESMLLPCR